MPVDAPVPRLCIVKSERYEKERLGFALTGQRSSFGTHRIINVLKNSPALLSGLRGDELLIEINGENVQGMSYLDMLKLLIEQKMQGDLRLLVADPSMVLWCRREISDSID